MKRLVLLPSLLLLLFYGCCPITSVHPLKPNTDESLADLVGIWQLESDQDTVLLHIGRTRQKQWQVLLAEHKEDGILEHAAFGVTTTSINHTHYMNLDLEALNPSLREGNEGNIILKITLPDRYTLHLSRLNLDAVVAAIGNNTLAGEIIYDDTAVISSPQKGAHGGKIQCARITADTQSIHHFLDRHTEPELFQPYLKFKRVTCIP